MVVRFSKVNIAGVQFYIEEVSNYLELFDNRYTITIPLSRTKIKLGCEDLTLQNLFPTELFVDLCERVKIC